MAYQTTSTWFCLLWLTYFALFLPLFFVILFSIAIVAVEAEVKTVVISEAYFPMTFLPSSPDTG